LSRHDWVSTPSLSAAFQALPGPTFIVNGATPPADSLLTTASAELALTPPGRSPASSTATSRALPA